MKTLVFSDTHLTSRFNEGKFQFLKKIIEPVDQVIINGDFWDGYLTSFDEFVKSDWKKLFPVLKQKKTIYIYGNHDKTKWMDKRVNLFSIKQTKLLKRRFKDKELIIQHGHLTENGSKNNLINWKKNKLICRLALNTRRGLTRILGPDIINLAPPVIIKHRKIKGWVERKIGQKQILICGHSHRAYFNPEKKYINCGFVNGSHAQYLIIGDEEIELVRTGY